MNEAADRPGSQKGHGRLIIALGVVLSVLVGLAAATAWAPDSGVAAQPANARTGDFTWHFVFFAVQAIAFAVFLVSLLLIRRWVPRLGPVLVIAVVVQVLPLVAPLMLSTDVWGYWSFARVSVENGSNPYVEPQSAFPDDAAYPYTNPQWRDNTTPYGPVFTLPSEALAAVAGDSADITSWAYKLLGAGGMVLLTLLVSRLAVFGAFAAAFVGWNPVFAMHFAGSGHNEVVLALLLVAAIGLARKGRAHVAGVVWAFSVFFKWTSLVVLPLQVLEDHARGRRSLLPALLVSGVGLAIAATVLYGTAWVAHPLSASGDAANNLSLSIWPRLPVPGPDWLAVLVPVLVFVALYLWLMRQAWHGRARPGLATILFLVASPYLWTWYLVTPAALSAVDDDRPAMGLTLVMLAYAGVLYLGDAGSVFRLIKDAALV